MSALGISALEGVSSRGGSNRLSSAASHNNGSMLMTDKSTAVPSCDNNIGQGEFDRRTSPLNLAEHAKITIGINADIAENNFYG